MGKSGRINALGVMRRQKASRAKVFKLIEAIDEGLPESILNAATALSALPSIDVILGLLDFGKFLNLANSPEVGEVVEDAINKIGGSPPISEVSKRIATTLFVANDMNSVGIVLVEGLNECGADFPNFTGHVLLDAVVVASQIKKKNGMDFTWN